MSSLAKLVQVIAHSCHPVIQSIREGKEPRRLGLRRSARLPVMAALHANIKKPLILVTDRADHALTLYEELRIWAPDATRLLFSEPTPLFYEANSWSESTRRDRILVLTMLASYHIPGAPKPPSPPMIIVPARALMTRTIPRHDFLKVTHTIRVGGIIELDKLTRKWVRMGYKRVNTVIAPGEFARRGGILDLWPPAEMQPVRIELFGDEIETLRHFDPSTQRTIRKIPKDDTTHPPSQTKVLITPAREFLLPSESVSGDDLTSEELESISEFDIPRMHPSVGCLFDYLPRQSLVLIDNALAVEDTIADVEEGALKSRADLVAEGNLPSDFPVPYLTWSELQDAFGEQPVLELGPVPEIADEDVNETLIPLVSERDRPDLADCFSAGPRFGGQLKVLIHYMRQRYLAGEELIIVSRQTPRLQELWEESSPPMNQDSTKKLILPTFIEGSLSDGWSFNPGDRRTIHLLTDGEIFGWRRPKPRYRPSERYQKVVDHPESAFSDLEEGDYVVHIDYGIGRFSGLVNRTVDGVQREYLRIEYADKAELFVPVHQVDRITRYIGADNRQPTLSRLGGKEWRNVKSRVRESVKAVAQDLLDLYATRSVIKGFAFSKDSVWQQELEASFPYIETEDQQRVLMEVKRDMESGRPMDRLICGDVGYGKTEVALRAAFKAVYDGKQVALLVPTTVLAQQHYNTFRKRLAPFPIVVEMLSRFRTPREQAQIIKRLAEGQIDILIGTHRLFSSDVKFKDLGLLIIDEEQRFGVTHKETLKKMRTEMDVLTLTATPIPRTLYMALSGIRDISTINTPPEERLPIVTHVGPYSERLVRQAILRELERGGQVFFVHNRVQTINAMNAHLQRLVPEARIAIAHGQMPEKELSQRMEQFTAGKVDVLLSTSIIESGLDIPTANTLIIDRADMFGLAQLYQLRGRVGRGAQRAYAYFFKHKRKRTTPEGRQRLETIAENTQLGAGFSIAMRDLEIRGTGDILGTRQHGHIAAVGFHLYTRLLGEAVRRLRAEGRVPREGLAETIWQEIYAPISSVNIELPLAVSIPTDYIHDRNTRLGLYRRLANIHNQQDVDAMAEELRDRFGPPPEPVENLFFQAKVKILAERIGLESLTSENGQIVMRYPEGNLPQMLNGLSPYVRIGKTALWMPYRELQDWRKPLIDVLHQLTKGVKVP